MRSAYPAHEVDLKSIKTFCCLQCALIPKKFSGGWTVGVRGGKTEKKTD